MLGFVVPVKPKKYSKDWSLDNKILERTVRSICGQNSVNFKLLIVYTDLPTINFTHPNVHFIEYPYGDISVEQITDWNDMCKWYKPLYAERMMDKSRKIILGCSHAKILGCNYLMSVDSDDLVSNKLADFVEVNQVKHSAGWRFLNGYMYEEGSKIMVKNHEIWGINGSTHIVRSDLVVVPDLETNFNLFDYNLFESHGYTMQRLIDYYKETMEYLPFYGVVYMIHNNNYSKVKEIISAITIKQIGKKILLGKLVSKKVRKEFGIYNIEYASK